MVWKKALATAGAKALGSIVGGAAQSQFSAKQAKRQMDFQERMSNTAYQRAAADLEAAGLNRILAIGSPASTPGGAMGNVAAFGEMLGGAIDTGVSAYGTAQQVNQSQAQTQQILEQTNVISSEAKIKLEQSKIWEVVGPMLVDAGGDFQAIIDQLRDPNLAEDFKQAASQTTNNVYNYMIQVMSDTLETPRRIVTDALEFLSNDRLKND